MATKFEARSADTNAAKCAQCVGSGYSRSLHEDARLSASELDVVRFVARGFSNAAIAKTRGCAERTVANHLARVYKKLGISGRRELRASLAHRSSDGEQLSLATLGAQRALSAREREIFILAAEGESNKSVAYTLGISVSSVSTYLRRARSKLGVAEPEFMLRSVLACGACSRPSAVSNASRVNGYAGKVEWPWAAGCSLGAACENPGAQRRPAYDLATEYARGRPDPAERGRHSSGRP
jgi:DNA-binding CsgD family transcriptional regulator